jgi:hypothetical protein
MVRKTAVCLGIALLSPASFTVGQQPATDPEQLGLEQLDPTDAIQLTTKWLEQRNPRLLAWAAFWTERDEQFQRVPQLLEIVAHYTSVAGGSPNSSNWTDQDAALQAVLDALICLHADVPANQAEALYAKFPVQALVLLSRSHDDTREALLRILDRAQWLTDWLAAANLLAAKPPAGLAARLIKTIAIEATLRVLDPGRDALGEGWGGDCASGGDGLHENWPPVGGYRLSARQSPASELLAAGENPVYLIRTPSHEYRSRTQTGEDCADRFNFVLGKRPWGLVTVSDLSRNLIGQLLGFKKDAFALELDPDLNVTWTTAKAYTEAANAFVREQEERLQNVVLELEARRLLTQQEAELAHPKIEVRIMDQRREKTPLPDLVFPNPSIEVTYRAVDLSD